MYINPTFTGVALYPLFVYFAHFIQRVYTILLHFYDGG